MNVVGNGDSFQAALLFGPRAIERIAAGSLAQMKSDEFRVLPLASISVAFVARRASNSHEFPTGRGFMWRRAIEVADHEAHELILA